jgi:hypothetical protein
MASTIAANSFDSWGFSIVGEQLIRVFQELTGAGHKFYEKIHAMVAIRIDVLDMITFAVFILLSFFTSPFRNRNPRFSR